MLFIKYTLLLVGLGMIGVALAIVIRNLNQKLQYDRRLKSLTPGESLPRPVLTWGPARNLAIASVLPLLLAMSIAVVPSGFGGVRVSQFSGTRPGTLYPGAHVVNPLTQSIALYDLRDQVLTTSAKDGAEKEVSLTKKKEVFTVQSREGLNVGLAITVRYRLDDKKLQYIHDNLPQPVEDELVPPVVSSVFREIVPMYTVRELFATKREEVRSAAAERITKRLGGDGIIVKEVMLRDIQLPAEFAKGLEKLLVQEQENEGLTIQTQMREKEVQIAELEAEAQKRRDVKGAEAQAQVRVLQAKAEADSMQYTLPLKEKQIQQTRLEAEARKESTIKNAEAQAQAKVIDGKAELERRNLMSEAEAKRIRVVAAADTERMTSEAALLKQNPLLINKIIAERLSDKLQVMMVPSDAKIFFNDVMKGTGFNPQALAKEQQAAEAEEGDDPPAAPANQSGNGGPAYSARRR
jgi:regulator of protease activity HflC (stomatin/prohibitin superfamily)